MKTSPTTTTINPTTTTTTPTHTLNPCKGKKDGLHTNPYNPNSFYFCAGEIPYIQYCQKDLVYDQNCKCCNYPTTSPTTTQSTTTTTTPSSPTTATSPTTTITHSSTTTSPTTTTTPLTTTTPTHTLNPCKGKKDGLHPNPYNPNSFYFCAGEIPYIQYCQKYLVYDQNCKCCNYPTTTSSTKKSPETTQSPTTTTSPTTTITHSTTTTSPTTTTTPLTTTTLTHTLNPCKGKKDGLHPNPYNLNSFYFCAGEIPYIQYCQKDLVYDQNCKCCNYPTTTSTSKTSPATTTTYPTTTTTPPKRTTPTYTVNPCKGKKDGLHANPHNPNSFYHCVGEIPFIQYCQKDLVYNQNCECCNYPTTTSTTKTPPTTTTTSPTTTTTPPTTTTTPTTTPTHAGNPCKGKLDGLYPGYYPHSYYNCVGHVLIQKCPSKFVFNEKSKCCERIW
ncbi:integumentary mucin C.1-like [Sebastes umbrosus]|uniref:integumentary mucin C.1-like n=1 Tax=Sebastes umbrosus TaxID=72105 RepID=UPI00189CE7C7|nr:integumentary mucin C.1-like [Sebastes umbrosus]